MIAEEIPHGPDALFHNRFKRFQGGNFLAGISIRFNSKELESSGTTAEPPLFL
jgi:hypothetical protein